MRLPPLECPQSRTIAFWELAKSAKNVPLLAVGSNASGEWVRVRVLSPMLQSWISQGFPCESAYVRSVLGMEEGQRFYKVISSGTSNDVEDDGLNWLIQNIWMRKQTTQALGIKWEPMKAST